MENDSIFIDIEKQMLTTNGPMKLVVQILHS